MWGILEQHMHQWWCRQHWPFLYYTRYYGLFLQRISPRHMHPPTTARPHLYWCWNYLTNYNSHQLHKGHHIEISRSVEPLMQEKYFFFNVAATCRQQQWDRGGAPQRLHRPAGPGPAQQPHAWRQSVATKLCVRCWRSKYTTEESRLRS